MLILLRSILLLAALGPLVYYVLSIYSVVRFFSTRRARPPVCGSDSYLPAVSILKPVKGVDPGAYENFASFCRLDYPQYEIIFAVGDPRDAIVPVIKKLQRDFPYTAIRLVAGVEKLGQNDKISNLYRLVNEARYELLVMSDSDVRVDRDYLRKLAVPFGEFTVGAVTAFYRCEGGGSLGADLAMLGMCSDSLPGALVARTLEGRVQFAFGWMMATTKERLMEIGGWEAMADYHSDDFELGNRISRQGHRVEILSEPVTMVFPPESLQDFFRQELRWAIGLRNVRPHAYAGMVMTLGLPWAVFAAIVAKGAGWPFLGASYLVAYVVLRLLLAWLAAAWGLRDRNVAGKIWLLPLRDAVTSCIWVVGMLSDRIQWRGSEFRVKNGLLRPVGPNRPRD